MTKKEKKEGYTPWPDQPFVRSAALSYMGDMQSRTVETSFFAASKVYDRDFTTINRRDKNQVIPYDFS